MIGRKNKRTGNQTARRQRTNPRSWLGAEIELIIRERERLLQAAGAAARLFASLNIRDIPREAREPVRKLGAVLESLSEETLTDAIEMLIGPGARAQTRGAH
jgi:hypothetical protein